MSDNMIIKRYKTLPVEVEAVQFDGSQASKNFIISWMEHIGSNRVDTHRAAKHEIGTGEVEFIIPTLEGYMLVSPGDYVIRGLRDEFYPCKPDIFARKYVPT